ncbi:MULTISPECIES: hypothetical protein [unclassified Cyanobium]|uniref:hypothetical protein n=1 Tax=unclassified Cyanobium TaxID=2627006 RepID=UPI0020CCADD1|nr:MULTISPECIES: hypothetical protein [unclassified Cyanobium]MCP9860125.1 hypothetical protein [Cyanobium sp. Cruz-8H5]MCP9867281.1 hypothetical protein [Cyanobium sp. Cruz-8D1]
MVVGQRWLQSILWITVCIASTESHRPAGGLTSRERLRSCHLFLATLICGSRPLTWNLRVRTSPSAFSRAMVAS